MALELLKLDIRSFGEPIVAYRIHSGDLVIECDTATELQEALRILHRAVGTTEGKRTSPNSSSKKNSLIWNQQNYERFWSALREDQQGFISLLVKHNSGRTYAEVCKDLHIKWTALPSMTAAISKHLKSTGLKGLDDLIIKESIISNGKSATRFKLVPEFRKLAQRR